MFDFLKKKPAEEPVASAKLEFAPAPGTEIRYNPELVPQLTKDHALLLELYGKIQQASDDSDFSSVSVLLDEFRSTLQDHLLTENVRLYIYLDRMLGRDPLNGEQIHQFRKEMDGIGKTVMNFLKKYDAISVDTNLGTTFKKDFATLGTILSQRIAREEATLYPLYLPSY